MNQRESSPLVAIVTPVYNGESFLAEALESVQVLDYPNLVHVVLDNASTDATPDIIQRFAKGRVPLLVTRNDATVPIEVNWSKIIELIPKEARYFWVLCADDTLAVNAIRRTVDIAESDPSVIIVGSTWRAESFTVGEELPRQQTVFAGKDVLRSYLRREHAALAGANKLVRCSAIDVGLPYYAHNGVYTSWDTEANLRACLRGKFGFVHEDLYFWRSHPGSLTVKVSRKMLLFEADWLLLLDRYGPHVLGHREYRECRRRFRRYLLRRLLVRFLKGDRKTFNYHMDLLRERDDPATFPHFVDALTEWVWLVVTGQRWLVGRPK